MAGDTRDVLLSLAWQTKNLDHVVKCTCPGGIDQFDRSLFAEQEIKCRSAERPKFNFPGLILSSLQDCAGVGRHGSKLEGENTFLDETLRNGWKDARFG